MNTDSIAKRWYVAICLNYWGRGHTAKEALAEMKKAGASKRELKRYVVKLLPPGAKDPFVDEFGYIQWELEDGADRTLKCEVVERRG